MTTQSGKYDTVFNRLCHITALSSTGKAGEVVDDLLATVLTIHDNAPLSTPDELSQAISATFAIDLPTFILQASIDRQVANGHLRRDPADSRFQLEPEFMSIVSSRMEDAHALEGRVQAEWEERLEDYGESLSESQKQDLWYCLTAYLSRVLYRHGAQCIQLISPTPQLPTEFKQSTSQLLATAVDETLPADLAKIGRQAITDFVLNAEGDRRRYLIQLLDGTFSYFALNSDADVSRYLSTNFQPISIFVDTNIILGAYFLFDNPLAVMARDLFEEIETNRLPFKLYYHTETLKEIERTTKAAVDRVRQQNWSPEMSKAAIEIGLASGLDKGYHRENSQARTSVDAFFSKFKHVDKILKEKNCQPYKDVRDKPEDSQRKTALVNNYSDFLKNVRKDRSRVYSSLQHDIAVWMSVQRIRGRSASVLDSPAFFLTADTALAQFSAESLRDSTDTPSVILPHHFHQILRPFLTSNSKTDAHFIDTLGVPEFRTLGGDYSRTAVTVLSYLSTYETVSAKVALSILSDELILETLKDKSLDTSEFCEVIESAVLKENALLQEEADKNRRELEKIEAERDDAVTAMEALGQNLERATEAAELAERERRGALADLESKESQIRSREASLAEDGARLRQTITEMRTRSAQLEKELKERGGVEERLKRQLFRYRSVLGLAGTILFAALAILQADLIAWPWLDAHTKGLPLKLAIVALLSGGLWIALFPEHRKTLLLVLVVPVCVAALGILA